MDETTKIAIEAITPMANMLGYSVEADGNWLYIDNDVISIKGNSAQEIVDEFVGFVFLKHWFPGRNMTAVEAKDIKAIEHLVKKYWLEKVPSSAGMERR